LLHVAQQVGGEASFSDKGHVIKAAHIAVFTL